MVDPFGTSVAAVSLIGTCIDAVQRVSIAIDRQTETIKELSSVSSDVSSVYYALSIVRGTPELETPGVQSTFRPIENAVEELSNHIGKMVVKSDSFTHQLRKGDREHGRLQDLTRKLEGFKGTLVLHICLASIDVFRVKQGVVVDKQVVVDYDSLLNVNQNVNERFGKELRLTKMLQEMGKERDSNGRVHVTEEEYRAICADQAAVTEIQRKIKINIENPEAYGAALQINNFIGTLDESWRAIGEINIKNCKAYGFAKQVNVPITDEKGAALIAEHNDFALKALQSDPSALAAILSQGLPPQLQ